MVKKSRMLAPHHLKEGEKVKVKKATTNVGVPKASKSGTAAHRKVLKKAFGK